MQPRAYSLKISLDNQIPPQESSIGFKRASKKPYISDDLESKYSQLHKNRELRMPWSNLELVDPPGNVFHKPIYCIYPIDSISPHLPKENFPSSTHHNISNPSENPKCTNQEFVTSDLKNDNVVCVRLKKTPHNIPCVFGLTHSKKGVTCFKGSHIDEFRVDCVYNQNKTNLDVFSGMDGPKLVANLRMGVKETLLAYGQTGSGKTHTIFGNDDEPGLIHFFLREMFYRPPENDRTHTHLKMSSFEIYGDRLNDLISPEMCNGGQTFYKEVF